MTKEYTGAEFEIEFARAWYEYVKGGKVGVDPRTQWECYGKFDAWAGQPSTPACIDCNTYRWKPTPKRMVTIGYMVKVGPTQQEEQWVRKTLVAPEVEALKEGETYWPATAHVTQYVWHDYDTMCRSWLNDGCVFLTREDATAMAEWLSVCRKGGAV